MKRKISLLVLSIFCVLMIFTGCNSKNNSNLPPNVGMYTNGDSSILLKPDGTFVTTMTQDGMSALLLTGKYTIKGEDIEFNSEKMNGEELGTVTSGKIKGDTITDPGGIPFTKDNSYKMEDVKATKAPEASNASPKAENSSAPASASADKK
ncbi:MAG: hypothetical protein Q8942_19480 [Bacillota bacterium]|nr:hypothetical protein [Bacillota bacterium]